MNIKFLYFAGKPVVGFNVNSQLVNKMNLIINFYPNNTIKKKIVRMFLLFLVFTKLDYFFLRKNSDLIIKIKQLAPIDCAQVLIRFHTLEEKSRCYCFYINNDNEFKYFGKIAFNEKNSKLLIKESTVLKNVNYKNISIPKFYSEVNYMDGSYGFSTNAIAGCYREHQKQSPYIPEVLLHRLQKNICSYNYTDIIDFNWWQIFNSSIEFPIFSNKLLTCFETNKPILLSCAHGDMGSENILENNSETYATCINNLVIIDWERYCEYAPYLTDALGYWLGYHHQHILLSPSGSQDIYSLFCEEFIAKYQDDILAVYLALAYLIAVKYDLASILAKSINDNLEIK